MPVAIMECGDYSEFQDALKNMRKSDDIIISTINSAIPTDSFHPDGSKACQDLYKHLNEVSTGRETTIKKCITLTADRVKKLREEREKDANSSDVQISKTLRSEQTKLRMLQVELTVEDLIKERTLKVFNDRCRKYFKPQ